MAVKYPVIFSLFFNYFTAAARSVCIPFEIASAILTNCVVVLRSRLGAPITVGGGHGHIQGKGGDVLLLRPIVLTFT